MVKEFPNNYAGWNLQKHITAYFINWIKVARATGTEEYQTGKLCQGDRWTEQLQSIRNGSSYSLEEDQNQKAYIQTRNKHCLIVTI